MCMSEPVKSIIENASALVNYIRLAGLGGECKPQLKKHVESRWNTVFNLLESVYLNYTVLGKILLAKEEADGRSNVMGKLTCINKIELKIICDFLSKFKIWTNRLESDTKPTLWMVWPIFRALEKHLVNEIDDVNIIADMKKIGREYVNNNVNSVDFEPNLIHKAATVLHPMLKSIAIASEEEKGEIYSKINEEAQSGSDSIECDASETHGVEMFDEFMGSQGESAEKPHNDEFQRYLNLQLPPSNPYELDLVDWWFKNRDIYPKLFRLFINFAGISASSSQSERSFSTAGIIIEARRSCLLPDSVQDLILARNKYLNFE